MSGANSTQMFTGLTGDRNSSKVLRPPGGGSSDIFGLKDEVPEVEKKAVVRAAGADMIGVNDVGKENEKKVENVENKTPHRGTSSFQLSDEQPDDQGAKNRKRSIDPLTGLVLGEKKKDGEEEEEKAPAPAPVKTGRVPPGGHSSGLW